MPGRVFVAIMTAILVLGGVGLAGVASAQDDRGSYGVPGLGARKQALLDSGGDTLDMAIAMLETDTMQASYVFGDGKSDDAANFGIFKQNWGMIRTCAPQYRGLQPQDSDTGAALNDDLGLDVQVLNMCQSHFGVDLFLAGHRNGSSGLDDPFTADIAGYKDAIFWIKSQIDADSRFRTDDTRFWVQVRAI